MRKVLVGLVGVLVGILVGCGSDSSSNVDASTPDVSVPDAPTLPDAPPPPDAPGPPDVAFDPNACPTSYGPAAIVNTFALANSAANAFDLDGDGTGDNSLAPTASLINGGIMDDLTTGNFRLMAEVRMLDDATLTDDPEIAIVAYSAVDTDVPVNAADDFSHSEAFWFALSSVDPMDCTPRSVLNGSISGGMASSLGDPALPLVISGFGAVTIGKPRFTGNVSTDTAGFDIMTGHLGGAIPTCPLQNMTKVPLGMNALHALTGFLMIQPDIDLDGDGIEQVQADSGGIIQCIDGDGTVIAGATCGCDPKIVDGYSAVFDFTAVGASVSGPMP
jgi:hypothetical protein